jgi:hypothetical protein
VAGCGATPFAEWIAERVLQRWKFLSLQKLVALAREDEEVRAGCRVR